MNIRSNNLPGRTLGLGFLLAMSSPACDSKTDKKEAQVADDSKGSKDKAGADAVEAAKPKVPSHKPCPANPAWFTAPSMPDGSTFPDNDNVINCDFHQWAMQSFAWLTSPSGKETVFEAFADPADLFIPTGPSSPYPGRNAKAKRAMLARFSKNSTTADIKDIFQAGPGNEVLVDQNKEVIYYSNHLNEQFWNFIDSNKFYQLDNLKTAKTDLDFPVDSFELKASWRVAEKNGDVLIPDADKRFHVVSTKIPVVKVTSSGNVMETDTVVDAKMALVGLHVTGIVANHPEFIWATFEHRDNAPDCSMIGKVKPRTEQGWSLYDGKAPANQCNQFDPNNPLGAVNVCRANPQGGGSAGNREHITTLDLHMEKLTAGSVWENYKYVGAVWTTGVVPLNNPTSTDLRGSLELANTTMESFKQDENCFSCHNAGVHDVTVGPTTTQVNGKHINLSHFVVNYQATQQATAGK